MDPVQMRSYISVDKRQFDLGDCFTTCLTTAILGGGCGSAFSPDYSCMCQGTFKTDTDTCLTNACKGAPQLKNAQSTWGYFCVYVNSGSFTGLPSVGTGGVSVPTSLFGTGKPSPTPTSPGNSTNGSNGTNNNNPGNSNNSNNGGGVSNNKEATVPLGAIIGAAVGGVALILMLVFIICYFRRRRTPIQSEKYPQSPPVTTFPQQPVPPQPPMMAHMNMGPSPVINPSMAGGASPNPSFNSATPFTNHTQGYAPSANSFVSGQGSYNNVQPVMSYPTQPSHLPAGAGMGASMSPQGHLYPDNTGPSNAGSPFLSPTSAQSHSFTSHPSMPPTSPSSSSIPTSDNSRLTAFSTNSQQNLLGMTSYSNLNHGSTSSPPSTGSSPSQQSAAQLSEKQRLQIHLEYQDGAGTSGSSSAGGSAGIPMSGFHVTNNHQQDALDGRSVVYSTTTTSGVGSKGGAYNVTNPVDNGPTDAPPVYSEQSR